LSSCTPKEGTAEKNMHLFDFALKQGKKDAATSDLVAGCLLLKTLLTFPAPIIVQPLVGPASEPNHHKLDLQTPECKGCMLGCKLNGELRMAADICEPSDCVVTQEFAAHSVDSQPLVTEINETVHADEESAGASTISKLFSDFFSV